MANCGGNHEPLYEPSQAAILAECEAIKGEWTPEERRRRSMKFRGRVIEDVARRYRLWARVDED